MVTNSILVEGPRVDSPRTVWAATCPGRVPVSWHRRRAAARAAIRRGWVTITRPVLPSFGWAPFGRASPAASVAGRAATRGGTKVVLPVPGGAWTTIAPSARPASRSARYSPIGSPAPMCCRSMGPASMGPGAAVTGVGRTRSHHHPPRWQMVLHHRRGRTRRYEDAGGWRPGPPGAAPPTRDSAPSR